ncbi:MAG: hypothetical protein WCK82_01220 [Bacteroidota bacterium]
MQNNIEDILKANKQYKEAIEKDLVFTDEIHAKGFLNKEIDKLYNSRINIVSEKQYNEIVVKSIVIIEKMKSFNTWMWSTYELNRQLSQGITYYLSGKDKSSNTFVYKAPDIICPDGHIVRSKSELIIDLYLCYKNIKHEYDKKIYHEGIQILMADFFLPELNLYLEFWGMMGNWKKRYN